MIKLLNKIRQKTGEDYKIKHLSNGGLQLINRDLVAVVGGPYGQPEREFVGNLKSFIKGLEAKKK